MSKQIRKLYHHDGEQLGFYKKVHIKTKIKKKAVPVMFILQETKNFNLFDKNCIQENVKCHIQHEESWRRWIVIEQVQVTLISAYISWKKLCPHTFKASLEEVIVMYSEKVKTKYMKEDR